jgi:hypothetical protein
MQRQKRRMKMEERNLFLLTLYNTHTHTPHGFDTTKKIIN